MAELSRQQRRALKRKSGADAQRHRRDLPRRHRPKRDGHYLGRDAFLPFFALPEMADMFTAQVEAALGKILGTAPIPDKGLRLKARFIKGVGEAQKNFEMVIIGSEQGDPNQSSHIAIMGWFDDGTIPHNIPTLGGEAWMRQILDQPSEIRIPLSMLTDPKLPRKASNLCWLYQIRFNTYDALAAKQIDQTMADALGRGYIGVTSRPFVKRMVEHHKDMLSGGGHLLHSVWRELGARGLPHRIIAQLSAWSQSEDEIYALEEKAVEPNTLVPKGLNMIPGGRNGLARMAQLGYSGVTMENRDRVLADAIARKATGLPFFRSSHIREYKPGHFTMVSGCWVRPGRRSASGQTPHTA